MAMRFMDLFYIVRDLIVSDCMNRNPVDKFPAASIDPLAEKRRYTAIHTLERKPP